MCTDAPAAKVESPTIDWRIGLVGFAYPEWTGPFYPEGLADHRRFAYYAARHNAVEINTTFYGPPSPATVAYWARTAPADFRFAIKAPRDVTHGPTPEGALANAQGPERGHFMRPATIATMQRVLENILELGKRLGPVLMQFPPAFDDRFRDELTEFLDRLAPLVERARAVAANVRLALEFRHASWSTAATADILAQRGMMLVHADLTPRRGAVGTGSAGVTPPLPLRATTDVLYLRFLGRHGQFRQRNHEQLDPTARLAWWKGQIDALCALTPGVKTVYAFFDNDFAGFAPVSAAKFAEVVGTALPKRETAAPAVAPTLFDLGSG
jgi:uncharacterized protein YecE (DUF72 family)